MGARKHPQTTRRARAQTKGKGVRESYQKVKAGVKKVAKKVAKVALAVGVPAAIALGSAYAHRKLKDRNATVHPSHYAPPSRQARQLNGYELKVKPPRRQGRLIPLLQTPYKQSLYPYEEGEGIRSSIRSGVEKVKRGVKRAIPYVKKGLKLAFYTWLFDKGYKIAQATPGLYRDFQTIYARLQEEERRRHEGSIWVPNQEVADLFDRIPELDATEDKLHHLQGPQHAYSGNSYRLGKGKGIEEGEGIKESWQKFKRGAKKAVLPAVGLAGTALVGAYLHHRFAHKMKDIPVDYSNYIIPKDVIAPVASIPPSPAVDADTLPVDHFFPKRGQSTGYGTDDEDERGGNVKKRRPRRKKTTKGGKLIQPFPVRQGAS